MINQVAWLRRACLVGIGLAVVVPVDALASPARRLARRGVVIVPAPVLPAPVVVGPALRPRRRVVIAPGVVLGPERVEIREQPTVVQAAAGAPPQPATAAAPAAPPRPGLVVAPPPVGRPPQPATAPAEEIPLPAATPAVGGPALQGETPAPFTPAWYARHPEAWRPRQPDADWWKAADSGGIAAWLRKPVEVASGGASGAGVVPAGGDLPGLEGTQSVLVLPAGHDAPPAGPEAADDWLPLGVFAVVADPTSQAHSYQQLAVDRSGVIKGNFYDAVSDTVQPIEGAIDREALKASWTVGPRGSRFEAPVEAFTAPPRTVTVSAGGTTRAWQLLPIRPPAQLAP